MVWPVLKVPYALSRARGMAREEVRRRCGAPDKEWETPAALGCYRGWGPQQRDMAKGRTWFYLTGVDVDWFAYFDANDRLYATEGNGSAEGCLPKPPEDGGADVLDAASDDGPADGEGDAGPD